MGFSAMWSHHKASSSSSSAAAAVTQLDNDYLHMQPNAGAANALSYAPRSTHPARSESISIRQRALRAQTRARSVLYSPSFSGNSNRKRSTMDVAISPYARLAGSSLSGVLEIFLFHPFDTTGKRLMSYHGNFRGEKTGKLRLHKLNQVVFRDGAELPLPRRYVSLYKGVMAASLYKISQRIYRFGGQPTVARFCHENYNDTFLRVFGPKYKKPMIHALAGSIVGVGEIMIVPLDVIKIKRQTNPQAFRGRSVFTLIRQEGFNLYQGARWTALRNAPGSFAMFGGAAFAKEHLLGLTDYNRATIQDNFIASIVGSLACILVANPFDVIKTRVQNKDFGEKVSGVRIIKELIREEGMMAFYKGFVPKMLIVGPKLMFAYTSALSLMQWFNNSLG